MIDIDEFVVSLMEGDILGDRQKDALRLILRKQFLEYSDGEIRALRQEYKFRYKDTVRRKSDGLLAKVVQAHESGLTIVEYDGRTEQIFVEEWDLVPIEPKFKVGDQVVRKGFKGSFIPYTIIAVDMAERRYMVGEHQFLNFWAQDEYDVIVTHVDVSGADPQTRRQLLAIQAAQHIEAWFDTLSDDEKEDFALKYPDLVIRKKED